MNIVEHWRVGEKQEETEKYLVECLSPERLLGQKQSAKEALSPLVSPCSRLPPSYISLRLAPTRAEQVNLPPIWTSFDSRSVSKYILKPAEFDKNK